MYKQIGISLIELIIALALSSMLVNAMLRFYWWTNHYFQYQKTVAHLTHQAILAADYLQKSIRIAGYLGCRKADEQFHFLKIPAALRGMLQSGAVDITNAYDNDSISIAFFERLPIQLLQDTDDLLRFSISDNSTINNQQHLVIVDCEQIEGLSVANIQLRQQRHEQIVHLTQPLSKVYSHKAFIGYLQKLNFHIAATSRYSRHGHVIFALYQQDINHHQHELVTDVVKMKITAAPSHPMITIDLLLASEDDMQALPQHYMFANQRYIANDKRLYKSWQIIIYLREH